MNSQMNIDTIEIEPTTKATRSVIVLHGLGADGNDFVPIIPELKLAQSLNIRFIFPHAPIIPVTINSGYKMRAWYDIYGVAIADKIDEFGISQSVKAVGDLIEKEVSRGVPTENIILAGFSQGAVIALSTGLTYPKKLGGIIALSGYLPAADKVFQRATSINKHTPIFIGHGTEDPMVSYTLGKSCAVALEQAGYAIDFHSYPMPHSVCAEEVSDIKHWIEKIFS